MKIIQTANGIQLIDDESESNQIDYQYSYNKGDIPILLIEECNNLYEQTGLVHFIFDYDTKDKISILSHKSKDEKREEILESLLDENNGFYISDENEFNSMPSRFSYYDTETKSSDKYQRYKIVVDFIKQIGFEPSEWNLGSEYEQSFSIELIDSGVNKWTLRLRPNLFLSIEHFYKGITEGQNGIIYDGFFNRGKILNCLSACNKSYFESKVRDFKLSKLVD